VIAKPGMGKTTLLFALLRHFQNSAQSAFLFDTQCNSKELLQSLLAEFKIQEDSGKSDISALAALRQFLLKSARANQRVLLVVDEAQNLDVSVFERCACCLILKRLMPKLLHIVLAGQPELGRKLALPELEQLRQRITIVSRLDVFAPADVIRYVAHRLKRAGYQGGTLFTPKLSAYWWTSPWHSTGDQPALLQCNVTWLCAGKKIDRRPNGARGCRGSGIRLSAEPERGAPRAWVSENPVPKRSPHCSAPRSSLQPRAKRSGAHHGGAAVAVSGKRKPACPRE